MEVTARDAVVLMPGEGERIGGPGSVTITAAGAATGGTLSLGEVVIEPGFPGPPPHVHDRLHDMFHVLEGTLTMRLGGDTVELPAGAFACVPPGVVHTFSNASGSPVRLLNLGTPAGWEDDMRDLAAVLASAAPTPEEIGAVAARYDFRPV